MMTIEMGATRNHCPKDIGILAMEICFPERYVEQAELEVHDGVAKGKYTIGLGQDRMAVCGPEEDAISLALTGRSNQ